MTIRRRPSLLRIRLAQRNLPTLSGDMAEEVIRLRRAMQCAIGEIDRKAPREARATLVNALQERWWR